MTDETPLAETMSATVAVAFAAYFAYVEQYVPATVLIIAVVLLSAIRANNRRFHA